MVSGVLIGMKFSVLAMGAILPRYVSGNTPGPAQGNSSARGCIMIEPFVAAFVHVLFSGTLLPIAL